MKKQTAVEWIVSKLSITFQTMYSEEIEQALAMEKQQSISDYCAGFEASGEGWNGEYGLNNMLNIAEEIDAENYFNQTYGGDK